MESKKTRWPKKKVSETLLSNARGMRKTPTKAEAILWACLRNRKLSGIKFRRQHPFEGYILDFYSEESLLCIELDGHGHKENEQIQYDKSRDQLLIEFGVKTIRFWNGEVETNLDSVLEKIKSAINLLNPLPHP